LGNIDFPDAVLENGFRQAWILSKIKIIHSNEGPNQLVDARDGPWPDPSLLLTRSKTRLWPRYFLTRPWRDLFDPKGKKLKNLTLLGENFQIQTQTINGWPNPSHQKLTRPVSKIFDLDPSLVDAYSFSKSGKD